MRCLSNREVSMNNAQTLFSMPGVGFIGMLIIGILAGYIAEKVTSSDHGFPQRTLHERWQNPATEAP